MNSLILLDLIAYSSTESEEFKVFNFVIFDHFFEICDMYDKVLCKFACTGLTAFKRLLLLIRYQTYAAGP